MSRVFYRIATVLIVLLDLGHTSGYPWSDPAWGVDLHAVQSSHFNVLGFSRTYWDFYVGFGLSVSVFLLLPALTAWQLGNATMSDLRRVRPTAWLLVVSFALITLLDWVFFFTIPLAFSVAITLCLAAAAFSSPSAAIGPDAR